MTSISISDCNKTDYKTFIHKMKIGFICIYARYAPVFPYQLCRTADSKQSEENQNNTQQVFFSLQKQFGMETECEVKPSAILLAPKVCARYIMIVSAIEKWYKWLSVPRSLESEWYWLSLRNCYAPDRRGRRRQYEKLSQKKQQIPLSFSLVSLLLSQPQASKIHH